MQDSIVTNVVIAAALLSAACVSADAQQSASADASQIEAAAIADRQRAARAESTAIAEQQQALQAQQRELAAARRELENARRNMETAARQISRLSSAGPHGVFIGTPGIPVMAGGARIGANIQNAETGALILGVTPGGPADEAGIMSGDVITKVNGSATLEPGREPMQVVLAALVAVEPGAIVPIEIARAGEAMTFEVEAGEPAGLVRVRNEFRGPPDFDVTIPNVQDLPNFQFGEFGSNFTRYLDVSDFFAARWRDMELVELTEDLGSYFGADEGLLVIRAPESDDLDLHDGDVIMEISGRKPNSPEHAMRILASFAPGETLEFEIMRRQRRQTIDYTIPERGKPED